MGDVPGTFQMCVGIDQHLLEASADRDVFEKAGEDRQAFLADRSGDKHAVRLDSAQLSRLEIGNDDYFHSDDLLRRILFRDARNDSANFAADVDFKLQQLVRAFYPFSRLYLADAKFDLSEVIDGDAAIGSWRCLRGALNRSSGFLSGSCSSRSLRCGLSRFGPESSRNRLREGTGSGRRYSFEFRLLHALDGVLLCAREDGFYFAQLSAKPELSPLQFVQRELRDVTKSELLPDA